MSPTEPDASRSDAAFRLEHPSLAALAQGFPREVAEAQRAEKVVARLLERVSPEQLLALDRELQQNPRTSLAAVLTAASTEGFWSLAIPRGLGGSGLSMFALNFALEQLASHCLGTANLLAAHGLALAVVGATGSLGQGVQLCQRIVADERRGQAYLLATAATEPDAGSDVEDVDELPKARFKTVAKACSGGFRLTGRKTFISNGHLAAQIVVVAPLDPKHPVETLSAFLVSADNPGLQISHVEHKLGQRACPAAEIALHDCFVSSEQRLGTAPLAGRALDLVLGASRCTVAAFGAGVAFGAYRDARLAASQRTLAGVRLDETPFGGALLARLYDNARLARASWLDATFVNAKFGLTSLMEIAALRQLDRLVPTAWTSRSLSLKWLETPLLDAPARRSIDQLPTRDIAVASAHGAAAKIRNSELALDSCRLVGDLLGVVATDEASGLPKRLRDARLLPIYEGTNEINALDVAKKTRLFPGVPR